MTTPYDDDMIGSGSGAGEPDEVMRTVRGIGPAMGRPLVIGAGLAGLVTAASLAEAGVPVTLLSAGPLGVDCASDWAQGGLAAAVGPDDDPELHVRDTLVAGAGLCEEDAVRRIVHAAPAVVAYLVAHGARFDRDASGNLRLGLEGGHSRRRIVHADGDGSGHEITRAMVETVLADRRVEIRTGAWVRRLLTDEGGRVSGVLVETADDGVEAMWASAVVLATGGAGALFAHTTNPGGSWGSGLALGLRAGAQARDLEMVQFHPTALAVGLDPMPLVSEAVRGEGAHLIDDLGDRVIDNDLSPRDIVSRAVWARLRQGRSVFLDTPAALGAGFTEEFPTIAAKCAAAGLDPATQPLPVRPAAHYHMGGLTTDEHARTTVPGLWAVGEVASTGLHGANRLASNSLLEAVAMGRAAATDVASMLVRSADSHTSSRLEVPSDESSPGPRQGSSAPEVVRLATRQAATPTSPDIRATRPTTDDRELLERTCGVLRDADGLAEAEAIFRRDALDSDPHLLAWAIAHSALARTESRGGHTRLDHPARDEVARHTVITLADLAAGPLPEADTTPTRVTTPASTRRIA